MAQRLPRPDASSERERPSHARGGAFASAPVLKRADAERSALDAGTFAFRQQCPRRAFSIDTANSRTQNPDRRSISSAAPTAFGLLTVQHAPVHANLCMVTRARRSARTQVTFQWGNYTAPTPERRFRFHEDLEISQAATRNGPWASKFHGYAANNIRSAPTIRRGWQPPASAAGRRWRGGIHLLQAGEGQRILRRLGVPTIHERAGYQSGVSLLSTVGGTVLTDSVYAGVADTSKTRSRRQRSAPLWEASCRRGPPPVTAGGYTFNCGRDSVNHGILLVAGLTGPRVERLDDLSIALGGIGARERSSAHSIGALPRPCRGEGLAACVVQGGARAARYAARKAAQRPARPNCRRTGHQIGSHEPGQCQRRRQRRGADAVPVRARAPA